jgi:uncharacterized protein YjlB
MKHPNGSEGLPQWLGPYLRQADVGQHRLGETAHFPNNPRCALLIYRQALGPTAPDLASAFEALFGHNGWPAAWRNGVYGFHHYHSTTHEVLGVYQGQATLQFGGDSGIIANASARDAIVIPAGVAHKNLGSSPDFGVVGAYPHGRQWDMNYGRITERPQADERIAAVPQPSADPLYGPGGPLITLWLSKEGDL